MHLMSVYGIGEGVGKPVTRGHAESDCGAGDPLDLSDIGATSLRFYVSLAFRDRGYSYGYIIAQGFLIF